MASASIRWTVANMSKMRTEAEVAAWFRRETARIADDDTVVREAIGHALNEAWTAAYGHRYDEGPVSS
jgi:hypothetical protein